MFFDGFFPLALSVKHFVFSLQSSQIAYIIKPTLEKL